MISQLGTQLVPQLTKFSQRPVLHSFVVILVVACAVLGGGRLASGSPSPVNATPASNPGPAPVPAAVQILQPLPTVAVSPAATSNLSKTPSNDAQPAAKAQAAPSVQSDPVRLALGLPDPASLTKIEDGVVAARALVSARGGSRAPEEAPAPKPTASPSPTPGPSPTPVASPSPTPAPKKDFSIKTHKVAPGETLMAIAAEYGITPETVLWANDLRSADLLQIDQELKILPVSGVLHSVKKGETLGGIADAYIADRSRIVEVNTVANPDNLAEGQVLIIPGGMRRTTEITGLPAVPSAQEIASAAKYTVKPGDTLMSIADAYGVRVSTIQVANGLLDPDSLRVGLTLSIPGGTQPAAAAPKPQAAAPAPAPKPAAAAPAPPPPPPAGSIGDQIAAIAQQYVGYRYVWGGASPSGFDCSGFTWYVYRQAGIGIPNHDLWGQYGAGPKVSRSDLQPGDLLFWQNTYTAGMSHTGIYLGGGRFINAETEYAGVQIRSINDPYWSARFLGASRPR